MDKYLTRMVMVPTLILFNIFVITPVLLGLTIRELEVINKKFGTTLKTYFNHNRYKLYQFVSIILIYWLAFFTAELVIIGEFLLASNKSQVHMFLSLGAYLLGATLGFIILFNKMMASKKRLLTRWRNFIALPGLAIAFGLIATSMSLNYIEEITGYSSSNFHSTEILKWVYIFLFILIILVFSNLGLIFRHSLNEAKQTKTEDSTPEEYISKHHESAGAGFALFFTFIIPTIALALYTAKLSPFFKWTFVNMNFHYLKHDECGNAPKNSLVAFLWRNTTDENNLLIADNSTGKWEFHPIQCKTSTATHKTIQPDASNDAKP